MKRHTLKTLFYVVGGMALLLWTLSVICNYDFSSIGKRMYTYKKDSQPIILWLNKYHSEHGKYPNALPERYQRILDNSSPKGTYSLENYPQGKVNFIIQFGEYSEDDFEFFWHSAKNRWMLDR